ncbi:MULTISPECIES: helix-turn-helix transcriptional regulator [unclassified Shewanella]|jgi:transcriptional regulator with XRE-family HTH domain|uniref:helix-turn-helix domain-containing protein n=1 Tax=unclassified Shewanella TaxID=196818 RepID=UPI000B49F5FC|nr:MULTISPECIES: helix-turn-helix transcriptional regulator [unclassified Shewanella]PIW61523.1 MAG: XRE family transcriptional regulator [Shewanella sp. CG12_big_fil_rev_8_21_14_0_65_47_15]
MDTQITVFISMSFPTRFLQLRKDNGLTQQAMADTIDIHITQVKRYEAGTAQPSLEMLKKIATAFHVTTDWLIFDDGEREPNDELRLQFEALQSFTPEEKQVAKSVLEGLILKHDANRFNRVG